MRIYQTVNRRWLLQKKTRLDETERRIVVDDTIVHTYSDQGEDDETQEIEEVEEGDGEETTQSAAGAADQSGQELLNMSSYSSVDPTDYGDAHTSDQHNISELRDDIAVTDPDFSVDKTGASHLEIEDYDQKT